MHLDLAIEIRDEISALLLKRVEGLREDEHAAVSMAARQLEQFGCMGGSTRKHAENEIVRLLKVFDDTQESSYGPWPVTNFMLTQRSSCAEYKKALEACIAAHKTGQYEMMVTAINDADNLIFGRPRKAEFIDTTTSKTT